MGSILVENLGKSYKTFHSCWGRFASWFGLNHGVVSEDWVLRNLSFKLNPGEAVGIVGKNGAGKSTLLKLITGTTKPSEGFIKMSGRVSALLELGMGFHPDLTGRQNAYLSATLLGLTQAEITNLMPSIEEFAEVGEYIDQPVRVYSSGMQARLAFSVATAMRPDILIVDEVLSVGDAYFQHKSFDRIRQYRQLGTTLLIVSHDKNAIQSICDRAILLSDGHIVKEGNPDDVMDYYHAMFAERDKSKIIQKNAESGLLQTLSGTREAYLNEFELLDSNLYPISLVEVGQAVTLNVKVNVSENIPRLILGYLIKDRLGMPIFGANTFHFELPLLDLVAGEKVEFLVKFNVNLGVGVYSITLALTESDSHLNGNFDWRDRAIMFEVVNNQKQPFAGCAWLETTFDVVR